METMIELRTFRIAHSNFRKGLCDYNDGSSLNHNLGNDDYHFGSNEAEEFMNDVYFDGRVAFGNNLLEDDEFKDEIFEIFNEKKTAA
jgi:hypothetical protein